MDKTTYIYFSGATDRTGNNLKEALNIDGDKKMPGKAPKVVIGWGAKTKKDVAFPKGTIVLNHPNAIRLNRNKLTALTKMQEGGTAIARFVTEDRVEAELAAGNINLPLIGRTKYHQGGKGFWSCPTLSHVRAARARGAAYFQEMIEIDTEYRFHVFGPSVIYAVKKVQRTDEEFKTAYIEDELARQKALWEKNNKGAFNEDQAREMLRRQANKAIADGADLTVRSNTRGWKFSRIKKLNKDVEAQAIKAVADLGLDFGAVDCCVDVHGNPFVIEVNTGPGLEGTPFKAYVDAFTAILEEKKNPTPAVPAAPAGPVQATAPSAPAVGGDAAVNAAKKLLFKNQLARLSKLIDEAPDDKVEETMRLGQAVIFGSDGVDE